MMNFFFFLKKNDEGGLLFIYFKFFFLKMNERWANAPSMEYEFMNLAENLDLINF